MILAAHRRFRACDSSRRARAVASARQSGGGQISPQLKSSDTDVSAFEIRRAVLADAPCIARHRVSMFRDMGQVPSADLAAELLSQSAVAIHAALEDGSYVGWLAVSAEREVIGGTGVHIKPQLPRITPDERGVENGPVPLVVNVYTEPAWRRRGVARELMVALMDWATESGYDRVVLHASDAGRRLYELLGFGATNEMRWHPPRR
jgi:GNAT superfamily N-acetyltransferase